MIKSMTGYGKSDIQIDGFKFELEIKSVNHRFCEISFQNIPHDLRQSELKIKKILSKRFARGHFYLSFHLLPLSSTDPADLIHFKDEILDHCYQALSDIKKKFRLEEQISLSHLLVFKEYFVKKAPALDLKALEEHLEPLLNKAMDSLASMRDEEGRSLALEINTHLARIKNEIGEIEKYRDSIIQNYKNRLFKKIEELKSDLALDPQRIAHEVVLFSDRMDIQEEITRLMSHIEQFEQMINGLKPAGRGMDFLLQEMGREINTIGSKTGANQTTLFIKQELEILREQVQNVE